MLCFCFALAIYAALSLFVFTGGSLFCAGLMQRKEKVSADSQAHGASVALCLHLCELPSSVTSPFCVFV